MHLPDQSHLHWYDRWIVLLCAFCNYVIVDGVRFTFGILYVELLDTFGSGKSETSWVGSVQVGLTNLGGVIAGSMVRRFGVMKTILIGTLLSCAGLIASSFTSSIYAMYVTYGVFPGFGLVMMSLASLVAVGQNFDKQQSLAMGICQAGGSVGGFVFNPLLQMFIETYGWQGALLIFAGILLHGSLFGLMIHVFGRHNGARTEIKENSINQTREIIGRHKVFIPKDEFRTDLFGSITLTIKPPQNHKGIPEENSLIKSDKDNVECLNCHNEVINISTEDLDELEDLKLADSKSEGTDDTCFAEQSTDNKIRPNGTLDKVLAVIRQVVPYKVLSDRPTLIFLISAHVRSFGFFVPFMLLPDLAVGRDVTLESAAWLASGMGISGAISRVFLGWIGDFPSVDRLYLYIFCILGSGILSAVCPSFYLYWLLMIYACVFGSLMGWLFEVTGDYNVSFILAGSLITLSGLLLLPLKCQRNINKREDE